MYCPYTNCDILENESSIEHIIPLSLGGVDEFRLSVDAGFNSRVGSELEGSLANEFMWALARTRHDARGHSGKAPKATIRRATYGEDNRVAQVNFYGKNGVSVWDVRDREYKSGIHTFNVSTSINMLLPIRFASKVALGAGYLAYGDVFRQHVDHQQFREVMCLGFQNLDLDKSLSELEQNHNTLKAHTYPSEPPRENAELFECTRLICSAVNGSVVMLIPGPDCFGVAVGILGHYLATVTVPADTKHFPDGEAFTLGHVVVLRNKRVARVSMASILSQILSFLQSRA